MLEWCGRGCSLSPLSKLIRSRAPTATALELHWLQQTHIAPLAPTDGFLAAAFANIYHVFLQDTRVQVGRLQQTESVGENQVSLFPRGPLCTHRGKKQLVRFKVKPSARYREDRHDTAEHEHPKLFYDSMNTTAGPTAGLPREKP